MIIVVARQSEPPAGRMQDVATAEAAAPRLRLAAQRAAKTAAQAQAEAAVAGEALASEHDQGRNDAMHTPGLTARMWGRARKCRLGASSLCMVALA